MNFKPPADWRDRLQHSVPEFNEKIIRRARYLSTCYRSGGDELNFAYARAKMALTAGWTCLEDANLRRD